MGMNYVASHLAAKRIREQQEKISVGSVRTPRQDGEIIARGKPENKKFYEQIDKEEEIQEINMNRNLFIFLLCFFVFVVLIVTNSL